MQRRPLQRSERSIGFSRSTAPIGENDMFRLASMTKAVTSVAAMILVEQGEIGLDDPVSLSGRFDEFQTQVLSFDIAQIAQTLVESHPERRVPWIDQGRSKPQIFVRLLRTCRERPCCRAAEK